MLDVEDDADYNLDGEEGGYDYGSGVAEVVAAGEGGDHAEDEGRVLREMQKCPDAGVDRIRREC